MLNEMKSLAGLVDVSLDSFQTINKGAEPLLYPEAERTKALACL